MRSERAHKALVLVFDTASGGATTEVTKRLDESMELFMTEVAPVIRREAEPQPGAILPTAVSDATYALSASAAGVVGRPIKSSRSVLSE